jgi:hypothetical protein
VRAAVLFWAGWALLWAAGCSAPPPPGPPPALAGVSRPSDHLPAGRWRARHGGLAAARPAGFRTAECRACHPDRAACAACHAWVGAAGPGEG